jgi:phosphatidylglycerol:prolipoprotein diacylglycerol transferase
VHPVLFEGPFGWTANAYGTLILIGMLLTVPGAIWDIRRRKLPGMFLVDVYVFALVGSVLGGELLHLATHADRYLAMPWLLRSPDAFGLVFYGSLLGMFAAMVWVARKHGQTTAGVVGFVLTWGIPAHLFGRLGCFMAGCCWGAPTDSAWAVAFPEGAVVYADPAIPHVDGYTVGLHPVQMYEASGLLLLAIALPVARVWRGIETSWGAQPARWAIGYGLLRCFTEIFRADPDRGQLFEFSSATMTGALALPEGHPLLLSTSQAIGLGMLVWGLVMLTRRRLAAARAG